MVLPMGGMTPSKLNNLPSILKTDEVKILSGMRSGPARNWRFWSAKTLRCLTGVLLLILILGRGLNLSADTNQGQPATPPGQEHCVVRLG